MPDAFGSGEFEAMMAIYTDNTYQTPYSSPPVMEADATLYVGNKSLSINNINFLCKGGVTEKHVIFF